MRWWTIIDVRAAAAAIVAALMARVVLTGTDDTIAVVFCAGLIAAALLAAYGVIRSAPGRRVTLLVAGAALLLMGVIAFASIGIPLFVAAVLALVAARTARPRPEPEDDLA